LHLAVPGVVARIGWRDRFRHAWLVMVATMLIDLDHLLADPIFDPDRCSIATHPLHGWWAIGLYVLLLVPKRTRLVGTGLVLHVMLDGLDCLMIGI
jgi:hypothetical protein